MCCSKKAWLHLIGMMLGWMSASYIMEAIGHFLNQDNNAKQLRTFFIATYTIQVMTAMVGWFWGKTDYICMKLTAFTGGMQCGKAVFIILGYKISGEIGT